MTEYEEGGPDRLPLSTLWPLTRVTKTSFKTWYINLRQVGPDGNPQPDGKIDLPDALVILRKAIGLIDW